MSSTVINKRKRNDDLDRNLKDGDKVEEKVKKNKTSLPLVDEHTHQGKLLASTLCRFENEYKAKIKNYCSSSFSSSAPKIQTWPWKPEWNASIKDIFSTATINVSINSRASKDYVGRKESVTIVTILFSSGFGVEMKSIMVLELDEDGSAIYDDSVDEEKPDFTWVIANGELGNEGELTRYACFESKKLEEKLYLAAFPKEEVPYNCWITGILDLMKIFDRPSDYHVDASDRLLLDANNFCYLGLGSKWNPYLNKLLDNSTEKSRLVNDNFLSAMGSGDTVLALTGAWVKLIYPEVITPHFLWELQHMITIQTAIGMVLASLAECSTASYIPEHAAALKTWGGYKSEWSRHSFIPNESDDISGMMDVCISSPNNSHEFSLSLATCEEKFDLTLWSNGHKYQQFFNPIDDRVTIDFMLEFMDKFAPSKQSRASCFIALEVLLVAVELQPLLFGSKKPADILDELKIPSLSQLEDQTSMGQLLRCFRYSKLLLNQVTGLPMELVNLIACYLLQDLDDNPTNFFSRMMNTISKPQFASSAPALTQAN